MQAAFDWSRRKVLKEKSNNSELLVAFIDEDDYYYDDVVNEVDNYDDRYLCLLFRITSGSCY